MRVMILPLSLLLFVGCDLPPAETPYGGAPPPVDTPVGPIPGPAQKREEATNPYADNPVALARGRKLFLQYNCAGCHGDHGGGGMGPSLRDVSWIYGSTDAHVFASIAEGRAYGMPAWGVMVPADQVWELVSYIKSLRTPSEPSPPSPAPEPPNP